MKQILKHPAVWVSALAWVLALGWLAYAHQSDGASTHNIAPTPAPAAPVVQPAPLPVQVQTPVLQYKPLADHQQAWPQDGRPTLLTFVQLTDTHVGNGRDHVAYERAVEAINAMSPLPDFVIITGDLTESFTPGQVRLFKKITGRLKPPVHLVPGNHDVSFDPNPVRLKRWRVTFPQHQTPYRVDYGPLSLIGVDSQLWNLRHKDAGSQDEAQRQWERTEALMQQAHQEGRRLMVFHHIPPMPVFYRKRVMGSWHGDRMRRWRQMLHQYQVEAELTGHIHRDELYMSGETLLLNAPPICQKYSRQASFRLFRVTPEGLTYRQLYLEPHLTSSYEMDLHGLTQERWAGWIKNLDEPGLLALWRRRYTDEPGAPEHFQELNQDFFRAYHSDPFLFQPSQGRFAKVP